MTIKPPALDISCSPFATRRSEGTEPLSAEEAARYQALVGRAAGDEDLFEKKRSEREEQLKRVALESAERRLPQYAAAARMRECRC